MSRGPDDWGGHQPEGRRARQPEGRRGRHGEGRRGRHDPDDTLPWLTGLEEASSLEEDAEWAGKLRPRQAPRVDMAGPAEPDEPPGAEPPGGDWRTTEPTAGRPLPEQDQPHEWSYDVPGPAGPGDRVGRDSDYGSWAHDLDSTAIWESDPRGWGDPPRADPPRGDQPRELPAADPAVQPWEPERSWSPPPTPAWEPGPRLADDPAAAPPAPWEAGTGPSDTGLGSLFSDPYADRFAEPHDPGPAGVPAGPAAPGAFPAWSDERFDTDEDATFAAAQAEARRLVEQATTGSWNLEPSWPPVDDRTGIDQLTDEPVVSFGPAPGRAPSPTLPPGPTPVPPPAQAGTGFTAAPGPGRALEPAAPSWDRPAGQPGRAAADPATRAWDAGEATAAGEEEDWLWPVDQESEARTSGGRRLRQAEGSRAGSGAVVEGRRVRQLEGRAAQRQASRPEGRRERQRDTRVRRRWPLRMAILAWLVLFAVVCWLYIFPWLEGVLPENF